VTLKSPISNFRCAARCLLFAALLLLVLPAAAQEQLENEVLRIPYGTWFREGNRQDIAWEVRVEKSELTFHQRLAVDLRVILPAKQLQKRSVHRELLLLVKIADRPGHWLKGEGVRWAVFENALAKSAQVEFEVPVLVRPGDYTLGVILYDRVTRERSVARRRLRVRRINRDPLPDLGATLPAAEFLGAAEEADALFRPELLDELNLTVATRRRVHVEVVANFSASEQYTGQRRIQFLNQAFLLPTLNVLSQLQLTNGSLAVTALDLDRRRVLFEQTEVGRLDWPRLKDALSTLSTEVVDTRTLAARQERGAFFREFLESRLQPQAAAADSGGEPVRVFLIVGSGILFPRGSNLDPVEPPEACSCRVYYLQYQISYGNLWDELIRIMRPLEPERFRVNSPLGIRRALAEILADLRAL